MEKLNESEKIQVVQVVEGHSKKPQNMDEMIVLYMEMKTSHMVMESRVSHLEEKVQGLFRYGTEQQKLIDLLMKKLTERKVRNGITRYYRNRKK